MAIVSVRRMFPGRSGKREYDNRVTYNDVYEVVTDDPADGETVVGNAVDPDTAVRVPLHGDSHPDNISAVVVSVSPEQSDESYYIWYVTVDFDNRPETSGKDFSSPTDAAPQDKPGEWPANPAQEAAKWRIGSIDRQEVVRQWLRVSGGGKYQFINPPVWVLSTAYKRGTYVLSNGNVYEALNDGTSAAAGGPAGQGDANREVIDNTVVWYFHATHAQTQNDPRHAILEGCFNSGKLPFDPPQLTDVSIPTIIVTKNILYPSDGSIISYSMRIKNAVNISVWRDCPPRTAKVLKFDAGNENKAGSDYIVATWEIGLDPDTWDLRLLDCGFGSTGLRTVPDPANPPAGTIQKKMFYRFRDPFGEPIDSAVPMDGAGGMLDPEKDPVFLRGIPRQQKLLDFNIEIPL